MMVVFREWNTKDSVYYYMMIFYMHVARMNGFTATSEINSSRVFRFGERASFK